MNTDTDNTTSKEDSNQVSRRATLRSLSDDDTRNQNQQTGRRGLIRGTAASAIAFLGFTNIARGIEPAESRKLDYIENELNQFEEQVGRRYEDERSTREAIQKHGREVLEILSERGYISEPLISELADATVEVDAVYEDEEDTFSSYLRLETETNDGQLGINVLPEAGLQYAVLSDPESTTATVFDPVKGAVEPDAVQVQACLGANCACEEYHVTCGQSGCWKDGKTGVDCCSCGNLNCRYVC